MELSQFIGHVRPYLAGCCHCGGSFVPSNETQADRHPDTHEIRLYCSSCSDGVVPLEVCPPDVSPGTRVQLYFLGAGHVADRDLLCRLRLSPGFMATVQRTEVYGFHTSLYLEEFPDVPFNTVNWAVVGEETVCA